MTWELEEEMAIDSEKLQYITENNYTYFLY